MIRPCFLGAGLATHLGTGVARNVTGLHGPPPPHQVLERRVHGRLERIPCRLLQDFPLEAPETRLDRSVETVIDEALAEARLSPVQRRRLALFVGSSSFDIGVSESRYRSELAGGGVALPLRSSSLGNLAETVRSRFGLDGDSFSFNTACTASANALWYAARMIAAGGIEHALVVGVELMNDLTTLGFFGLGLLTRTSMRPFEEDHDGIVLGEACAALVIGPGDASQFHCLGGANVCDTTSVVAAATDGSTIAAVLEQALAEAGLPAGAIDAVKAHGTASPANDEGEAAGLRRAFPAMPPVCAIKPFIGHTLGACGLAELVLFYRAIERGFLLATPGVGAAGGAAGISLTQTERRVTAGSFMLNAFGFGGNNTALVISRA